MDSSQYNLIPPVPVVKTVSGIDAAHPHDENEQGRDGSGRKGRSKPKPRAPLTPDEAVVQTALDDQDDPHAIDFRA